MAVSLNVEILNRPKVKSVDKYYRDRKKVKQESLDHFIKVGSLSYRKTGLNHDNEKSDQTLFKLFPLKQTPKSDRHGASFRSMIGLSRLPSKIVQKKTFKRNEDRFAE